MTTLNCREITVKIFNAFNYEIKSLRINSCLTALSFSRPHCYVNLSIQQRVCLILDKALGKNGCEEMCHLSGNSFYVPSRKNSIYMKRCFLVYFCLASLLSGSSHPHRLC